MSEGFMGIHDAIEDTDVMINSPLGFDSRNTSFYNIALFTWNP